MDEPAELPGTPDDDPIMPDPRPELDEDGRGQIVLTADERKAYLGRMIDFEARLAELTDKQAAFVLAVLKDPSNYTQAARVAGYRIPNVEATRQLNNGKVAAAIAAGEQLREDRTMLTTDRTLHEFAIVAFSDITNFAVDDLGNVSAKEGVPSYATRAISALEVDRTTWTEDGVPFNRTKVKIRLWSKTDALKMLAMYQKLLSGDGGVNIGNLNIDARRTELHKHEHNTWQIGDQKVTF